MGMTNRTIDQDHGRVILLAERKQFSRGEPRAAQDDAAHRLTGDHPQTVLFALRVFGRIVEDGQEICRARLVLNAARDFGEKGIEDVGDHKCDRVLNRALGYSAGRRVTQFVHRGEDARTHTVADRRGVIQNTRNSCGGNAGALRDIVQTGSGLFCIHLDALSERN